MARWYQFMTAVLLTLWLASTTAFGAPPREGELDKYGNEGTLQRRQDYQQKFRNDKYDPVLLNRASIRLKQLQLMQQGKSADEVARTLPLPPPDWRGMPTTGTNNVLVMLIEFNDQPHTPANSRDFINASVFGNGIAANYPYESLTNYYRRSSFGKQVINGNTLGWYKTAYDRSQVAETDDGRESLIKEAMNYFNTQGHDFSRYDNDNDGDIDYFVVIYSGDNTGWGSFWWAYQTGFVDTSFQIDGKRLSTYVFQFQNYDHTQPFVPNVIIHETGHALGLPDLYDYNNAAPIGGVGGLDMMDANRGDHNCFSKWLLEWSTPRVIDSGEQQLQLRPAGTTGDAVVVMPGASVGNPFGEYFMVENRNRSGNDDASNWPGGGLLIWHVNAKLTQNRRDFQYNNQTTRFKLLRLMEADGLEQIEAGGRGDPGDFYKPGSTLSGATNPNSNRYDASASGVFVKDIANNASGVAARIGITQAHPSPVQFVAPID